MATINKIPKCPPLRFPDFPDDWTQTTLGEIASFCGGGTPSSEIISYWNGHIPWISSSDISTKSISNINTTRFISEEALSSSATKLCKAPCIVIVSRVGVGKLAYSENDICTSQDFCNMYDIKGNYIFMSYRLLPIMNKKSLEVQGTSIKGITMQEIKSLLVSLPSLAEQKKIADFLSLIDERINNLSETIAQRKSFRNGIIKLIVGNLKADRISLKECVICNTSSLSESKLDVIGIPVYGASGIVGYTSVVEADQCAILIIKDGSGVGRLKYIDSPHSFTGTLNSLKSKNSNVNLRYVYYCMSTLDLKKYSTGTGIPHIYFKDYGLESIPLPSLAEQKRIADFLSLIDERIEVEEQLLQQYEKQKRYLLKQMFF